MIQALPCASFSIVPKNIDSIRNGKDGLQYEFIEAIQDWDLDKILRVLEKGKVNPHEMIVPKEDLARKLFQIEQINHVMKFSTENEADFKKFIEDCTMPAWMLISLFSEGVEDKVVRTEIMSKINSIMGNDFDPKSQAVYKKTINRAELPTSYSLEESFIKSYRNKVEELKNEDKNLLIKK